MAKAYLYDLTDTWNAGATTFTAIKMNVTDTASNAASLLLDLQVGGVSKYQVTKAGAVTTPSGTIASAAYKQIGTSGDAVPLLNAVNTWSANQTINTSVPRLYLVEQDQATDAQKWINGVNGGSFTISILNDAESGGLDVLTIARSGFSSATVNFGSGITIGSPTGGNKGAGTLNATAVYDDNVLLTCYVLEHWIDGAIDLEAWDARTPDRNIPATYINGVETAPARVEVRQHLPARGFAQVADARLDIDQFRQFLTDNRRLPAFPGPERWADMFNGKMSTGDVIQRLWETIEVLAVHIAKARERELLLESRITAIEGNNAA